jgi:hypothetical protein
LLIAYFLPFHLTIPFFLASIMDEINPREIMKLAIGAPSEYTGLLKRTCLDCMAELKITREIVIKLKLNRTTSCVLKSLILL